MPTLEKLYEYLVDDSGVTSGTQKWIPAKVGDPLVSDGILSYLGQQRVGDEGDSSFFMDYNHQGDGNGVQLIAETWTDVPNDGLGSFTNNSHKPESVYDMIDTSTGYLDFSDLSIGSQVIVRNDFKVVPGTNNSLLQVRYVLGQGAGEYNLLFWSERLDNGSGIQYDRVLSFPIYVGDTNTQGGSGKLQVKLSSNGTLYNSGSYINIFLK